MKHRMHVEKWHHRHAFKAAMHPTKNKKPLNVGEEIESRNAMTALCVKSRPQLELVQKQIQHCIRQQKGRGIPQKDSREDAPTGIGKTLATHQTMIVTMWKPMKGLRA